MNEQVRCRYCGNKLKSGDRHHCENMKRAGGDNARVADVNDTDFFIAAALVATSSSWSAETPSAGGDKLINDEQERQRDNEADSNTDHESGPIDSFSGGFDAGSADL